MKTATSHATVRSERERFGSVALDQWRGLALILVLINHGFYFTDRVNGFGRVGVNLFFFISGILVFRSLARSRAQGAWSCTRAFWWRRLRRLYPALVAYVVVMLAVTWGLSFIPALHEVANFEAYVWSIPSALAYTVDYFETVQSLGHLWSLGCEMQFYLLAPLLWIVAVREPWRFWFFGLVLAGLVGLGLIQPFLGKWKYHFEFAVWPMMFGFCCEYRRHWFEKLSGAIVRLVFWVSVAVCVAGIAGMLLGFEIKLVVIALGTLLLLPCFLSYTHGRPVQGQIGRGLEWLGVRTYSIYLWQQPFTICNFLPNFWHPVGVLLAIALGSKWFQWFEFPFLSAGRQVCEHEREVA